MSEFVTTTNRKGTAAMAIPMNRDTAKQSRKTPLEKPRRLWKSLSTLALVFAVEQAAAFTPDISTISAPNADWSLAIDLAGTELKQNQISPDGDNRAILVNDKKSGLTISVYIEKADHEGDARECRKFYWAKAEKSPIPMENVVKSEKNDIAFVEYDIKEFKGKPLGFRSLNAYLSQSGFWVDVHLSKTGYEAGDKAAFDRLIASIKIVKPKARNVSELLMYGSQAYFAKNYKAAIPALESAIEPEKGKIGLEKTVWYMTVDNLGMAYGVTGDFANSKRILEYGIKLAPEYPNFYYSLACTFAETSEIDKAIQNLELAYRNKANLVAGEKMPNPREDSSFKNHLKDDKFKQFLKKYDL